MNKVMNTKDVGIGWISSLVEAYNMAIYSFVAPCLAPFLFAKESTGNALFFSYALILIAACIFYPLGSVYYGQMGDKQGRQKTCVHSTLGLAAATGLMGCLPFTHDAWLAFLGLICAQHFFSGGEYQGSIVFSLEHAGKKEKGLLSALSCLFAVFGLVMANGIATVFDSEWGIRLCFILGGMGGIVSYFLKNRCSETPAFSSSTQTATKWEWVKLIPVASVLTFFIVSYTFIFIFLPLVFVEHSFDTFKSLIGYGFFLVLAGIIADRLGMERVMKWGVTAFCVTILPLCLFVKNLFILQTALTICASLLIGPVHGWVLSQFDVSYRCRGIFISSAIAFSVFGGSTVPICLKIFELTHSLAWCALYPLLIGTWAFAALSPIRKNIRIKG